MPVPVLAKEDALANEEFAGVELHIVAEMRVGTKAEPVGVILLLRHGAPASLMSGGAPALTSLFLTPEQADELSVLLAKQAHRARPRDKPDA